MSLETARERYLEIAGSEGIVKTGLVTESGKLAAHSLFPDDFEYYLMALELVDGSGIPTDRFVFPVMPNSINMSEEKITTIKKTASGITTFTNNGFTPKQISISGTFGRRFRLLIGNKATFDEGDLLSSVENIAGSVFVPNIKTGYGALKLLERIYEKSTKEKNGNL